MRSLKLFGYRLRRITAAAIVLTATMLPAFTPALAAAADITTSSIALSSSSAKATGVTYDAKFTPATTEASGAFTIDFCSNSPTIGDTCTAPTGFDASGATTSSSGFTLSHVSANHVEVDGALTASSAAEAVLAGITNPTNAGALYARIITYDTTAHAGASSPSAETGTGATDNGGVAMNITDTIGVTGSVLESMTFCVSGQEFTTTGSCTGGNAPTVKLGSTVSGSSQTVLSTALSTGTLYTQISTNAAGGAVVNLKNNNSCGGLMRVGATGCDIAPATATTVGTGTATFGVATAADTANDTALSASGTYQPESFYNSSSNYKMNWVTGNASGVSSVYGDPIFNTNTAPVSNKEMSLTFGASASNLTPAGNYSANLSLIATGTF